MLGESRDTILVVSDEDDARLAVWIERRDAATTIVAEAALGDDRGHHESIAGVWLAPGADIEVGQTKTGMHEVTVRDEVVRATGWVPDDALGMVWTEAKPVIPSPQRARAWLAMHRGVHEAARADARVLADLLEDTEVVKLGVRDGWVEVELHRPRVRVRGFIPARHVSPVPFEQIGTIGHGSGTGYGISDTTSCTSSRSTSPARATVSPMKSPARPVR